MIVVDASTAVAALVGGGEARHMLATELVAVPHLIDAEVVSALRSLVRRGSMTDRAARSLIGRWSDCALLRMPLLGLVSRAWELRHNLTAYDAIYVALAEDLGCALHTADRRIAAASGPRCPIVVLPS